MVVKVIVRLIVRKHVPWDATSVVLAIVHLNVQDIVEVVATILVVEVVILHVLGQERVQIVLAAQHLVQIDVIINVTMHVATTASLLV